MADMYSGELKKSILTTKRSIEDRVMGYPAYAFSAENARWLDSLVNNTLSGIDSMKESMEVSEQQEKIMEMSRDFCSAVERRLNLDLPNSIAPVYLQYATENRALKETSKTWFLMLAKDGMTRIRMGIGGSCCFFGNPSADFILTKKDKNSIEFDVAIPRINCGMQTILVDSIWKDGIPCKVRTEKTFEDARARFKIKHLGKGHYIMRGRVLRAFGGNTQENPFGVQFDF